MCVGAHAAHSARPRGPRKVLRHPGQVPQEKQHYPVNWTEVGEVVLIAGGSDMRSVVTPGCVEQMVYVLFA